MINRAEMIVQKFDYLINEYGFHITRKEFDAQSFGNTIVVFTSSKYGIEIVIDRNQVLISIGESSEPRVEWFDFSDVVKYYAPYAEEPYDFPEKTAERTWDAVVEIQLRRLSAILHQYCETLLKGEDWIKEEVKKIEEKRAAEMLKKFHQGPTNSSNNK